MSFADGEHECVDVDGAVETLNDFGLSFRARKILRNAGIAEPEQVRRMSDLELRRLPNLGNITLRELRAVFGEFNGLPLDVNEPATPRSFDPLVRVIGGADESARQAIKEALRVKSYGIPRPPSIDEVTRQQIQDVHNVLLRLVSIYEGLRRGLNDYSDTQLLDELRQRSVLRQN